MPDFQNFVIAVILVAAVGYGCWRIYEALKIAKDPCYGCSGCPLKSQKQREKQKNADCWHKK